MSSEKCQPFCLTLDVLIFSFTCEVKFPLLNHTPSSTTATAHTFAFEFDLVMNLMAIFSNKQAEVSTGEKT